MRVRKLPIELEAERYAEGMEDGYMCYEINGRFIGYWPKDKPLPRVVRKPAIMTLEGPVFWVNVGQCAPTSLCKHMKLYNRNIIKINMRTTQILARKC